MIIKNFFKQSDGGRISTTSPLHQAEEHASPVLCCFKGLPDGGSGRPAQPEHDSYQHDARTTAREEIRC